MDVTKISITNSFVVPKPGENDIVFLLTNIPFPNPNKLFGWGDWLILQFSAPEGLGDKHLNDIINLNNKP